MKQLANFGSGLTTISNLICGDFEHDGRPELTFVHFGAEGDESWQVWECGPQNQYRLVRSDTWPGFEPGTCLGGFFPMYASEADDGRAIILGVNTIVFGQPDTEGLRGHALFDSVHYMLCLYKSRSVSSYPDTLVWYYDYGAQGLNCAGAFSLDMDSDQRKEIVFREPNELACTSIFEDRRNDSYELVYRTNRHQAGLDYAAGDFDKDGRTELVTVMDSHSPHYVLVYRCIGDDAYAPSDSLDPRYDNGMSLCTGDDLDGDGSPEFFVVYDQYTGTDSTYVPCMYESNGHGSYNQTVIDSIQGGNWGVRNCTCSDIDCDGREELLVSYKWGVRIYKAVGDNQFEQVWDSRTRIRTAECQVRCFDMNGNGYPEIIISGGQTWIFELEVVRCTRPEPREVVRARGEGQSPYIIAWQRFSPPACDSFALDYTIDNGRTYLPIATGLHDTTYPWMVPDVRSDSCRIRVTAFGPHVMTDETDSCFSIRPLGVEESEMRPVYETKLLGPISNLISGPTRIRFQLREQENVSLVVRDVTGRQIRTLARGKMKPGIHDVNWDASQVPAGIYFVGFRVGEFRQTARLIVAR